MRAYTTDVIKSCIRAYFKFGSYRKAAAASGISKTTICRWVNAVGQRCRYPKKRRRSKPAVTALTARVQQALDEVGGPMNASMVRDWLLQKEIPCSLSSVYRSLRQTGNTFKSTRKVCIPMDEEELTRQRAEFERVLLNVDPSDVLSVDESSFDTNMLPKMGYSPKGRPLIVKQTGFRRGRCTLVLAVSITGLEHWTVLKGNCNTRSFAAFVQDLEGLPQKHVLMDNIAFHKSKRVADMLQAVGKVALFIPPYSPAYNPIEVLFHSLKVSLRSCNALNPFRVRNDNVETVSRFLTERGDSFDGRCSGAFKFTWSQNVRGDFRSAT